MSTAAAPAAAVIDPFERFPPGQLGRMLFWIAVAFSAFQLATAAHVLDLPSQIVRAVHVGFLLLLGMPIAAAARGAGPVGTGARLGGRGRGRGGRRLPVDRVRAADPARRRPDPARHRDRPRLARRRARRLVGDDGAVARRSSPASRSPTASGASTCRRRSTTAATTSRRSSTTWRSAPRASTAFPIYVSATYIFLFILFGSFLERAGMIRLFSDVALALVGHRLGGPAKVAVVSSALMGTISGSGVANVVTTGAVHHPADEALRLPRRLRRRRRGDGLDGRPDHAAGDGRRRLHHGRDPRRALRHRRAGGDRPGAPLLRLGLLDGPPRGRQARPRSACRATSCPRRARRCARTGR